MPSHPLLTCNDVAACVAELCSVEPWMLGENTKANETVQARDLYIVACDRLGLIGAGTPEDWQRVAAAIESDHGERALRKMRLRGDERDRAKVLEGRADTAWFPSTLRKALRQLSDLDAERAQTLPGMTD